MTDPYANTLNTHQDGDCDKVSRNRIYNCFLQVPTVCGIDNHYRILTHLFEVTIAFINKRYLPEHSCAMPVVLI